MNGDLITQQQILFVCVPQSEQARHRLSAADANPTSTELASKAAASLYAKGEKFVIAYYDASGTPTMRYLTLALDGATSTFTLTTTAP